MENKMYRLTLTKTILSRITVLCIFLLFPLIGMGQRTIEGKYCEEVGMLADDINYFEFYSDGFFVYEKHSDFGNYKATGRYRLTNDSLFLSFSQPPESDPSPSIYSEPIIDSIATEPYSTIRIYDAYNIHNIMLYHYTIYDNDSIVERGEIDAFGMLRFNPTIGTRIEIHTYKKDRPDFNPEGVFSIAIERTPRSYIYLINNPYQQYNFTGYTVGFEVRVKKNYKLLKFFIKDNDFFHPTEGIARYNLCE